MNDKYPISVILTDDHRIAREGIKVMLGQDEEIKIIGEASNGEELLNLLATTPADLVLLDVLMPVMDGLETVKQVKLLYPQIQVLALSMLQDTKHVQKMMAAGAAGYVLKDTCKSEMKAAIKLVSGGGRFMCSNLALDLLSKVALQDIQAGSRAVGPGAVLSARELEVLELIADGYTNLEIADKLFASKRTIETHRQNMLEKTNSKNTAQLVKFAIDNSLISLEI
ncbi:response regulator transcription factor [Pontibacter sp. SGAir0037]|uniref:response regulator n=1 Tax=Pontibacter sp. SGAir0037 TaxID=2571030 RepID=UPI0010CD29CA|nr:response regulator transcription factor [Pontibacter sp. SGAir0037]QCR21575.1 DNA-binding response regulator [Pontibacter sp. SGAir0037]